MPLFKGEEPQLVRLARLFVSRKRLIEALRNEITTLREKVRELDSEEATQRADLKTLKNTIIEELGGE